MQIVFHKAKRADNGEEVRGLLTRSNVNGEYSIADNNGTYEVVEDTITPIMDDIEPKIIDANAGYEVLDKLFAEIQRNDYVATQQMLDNAWQRWVDLPVVKF